MGAENGRRSEGWESNVKPCDIISYWRRQRRSANQQYKEIQSALRPAPGVHTAASSANNGDLARAARVAQEPLLPILYERVM